MTSQYAEHAEEGGSEVQWRSYSNSSPTSCLRRTCGTAKIEKKNALDRSNESRQQETPQRASDGEEVIISGVYARYSSANQSPQSCQTQTDDILKDLAAGRLHWHLDPDASVVVPGEYIFHDDAASGGSAKRHGFESAKAAIKNGEIKKLFIADTSRAARKVKDLMTLVELCVYHDCELVFAWDRLSTANPETRQMLLLKGVIDESSNQQHALRTTVHMRSRAEQGLSVGSLPYGYSSRPTQHAYRKGRPEPSHFEIFIVPERAEVVRRIFREYADGVGLRRIVHGLNDNRIPSPGQSHKRDGAIGKWSATTLHGMLRNARYVGVWRWRLTKRVIDPETGEVRFRKRPDSDHVTMGSEEIREDLRIVDGALWERVQTRLRATTKKRAKATTESGRLFGHNKTAEAYYLFTSQMVCGACGGRMHLASGRQGGRYGCYNAHRLGTCKVKRTVMRTKLEDALLAEIQNVVDTEECALRCADLYNKALRKRLGQDPEEIDRLKRERRQLQHEGERLVDFIAGGDTSAMVRERLQTIEERAMTISNRLLTLEAARRDPVLMTQHAMRKRLRGMVELLRGDPVRARPVVARLFQAPLRLELKEEGGRPFFWAVGEAVVRVDQSGRGEPAMTREIRVVIK